MKPFPNREMPPINSKIAARLYNFQDESNMSIAAMAELLCLEKGTYHSYVNGKALPPVFVAEKILRLHKNSRYINLEWLYYGDIVEYINDFLKYKGHNGILELFPIIPKYIYLTYDIENSDPDSSEEQHSLSDQEIMIYFEKVKDMLRKQRFGEYI